MTQFATGVKQSPASQQDWTGGAAAAVRTSAPHQDSRASHGIRDCDLNFDFKIPRPCGSCI